MVKVKKILIIKIGSRGDALRTTAILPALKEAYPEGAITWLVGEEAKDVLENNSYLDITIFYRYKTPKNLRKETFDLAINLDNDITSSALMNEVNAKCKKGFALAPDGVVYPLNDEAIPWHEMSLDDDRKKANIDTHHDIIHDIAGLEHNKNRPILSLTEEDVKFAKSFLERNLMPGSRKIVGINLGGSGRWLLKSPDSSKWIEIIKDLSQEVDADFLLFGGKKEKDKYMEVMDVVGDKVVGTGINNTFGEFASLINCCDLLITPDTLALHIATALDRRIVALFGPTSSAEIELYSLGVKVFSSMDCLCCYREKCDKDPNCMTGIDSSVVANSVKELLSGK